MHRFHLPVRLSLRVPKPAWIPRGILGRIRWLFLLFSLLNVVGVLPLLIWASPAKPEQRGIAAIACLALVGIWVRGYRRAHFRRLSIVFEFAAVLILTTAANLPEQVLGVLFAAANFRATYGKRRDLAATVLGLTMAYLVGRVLVDGPHLTSAASAFGPQLIGLAVSAVVMYVLAQNLAGHERSAAREHALAGAGADLMAATSREEAIKAVLEAVLEMLSDAGVTVKRVSLAARSATNQMTVIAARGLDAGSIHGTRIDLNKAPLAFLGTGSEQREFAVDTGVARVMATFLGFAPHMGVVILTPLSVNRASTGLLIVESAAALPAECGDGLLALSAEAALSLGAIQLTYDLLRDIEQRQALQAQLTHQAFHDALTALPNRALFGERTQRAIDHTRAFGGSVAVLFVDLDGFKTINDSLGHGVGDQLLVELSARLRAASLEGTLVARLGGDEFAILLEDVTDTATPLLKARETLDVLSQPVWLAEREVAVQASIGIATSTPSTDRADELLRNADMAMYTAKRAGKGRYAVYEESMGGTLLARLDLEADLRVALDKQEFVVHYQPILSLLDERIIGLEALVRWQHPRRGILAPVEFIELAEDTGFIVPLGRWVLRQACQDVAAWQGTRPGEQPLMLSVNLSSRQLQDPDLPADISAALGETGLAPGSLYLEITERSVMRGTELTGALLQDLRRRGAKLAMDDFGTGYSSLAYLLSFPLDVLKIDRVFIEHLGTDANALAVTQAIVNLGHSLGLRVVAEGIEHADQVDVLQRLRCDGGQGFFFARPLEATKLTALLQFGVFPPAPASLPEPRSLAA